MWDELDFYRNLLLRCSAKYTALSRMGFFRGEHPTFPSVQISSAQVRKVSVRLGDHNDNKRLLTYGNAVLGLCSFLWEFVLLEGAWAHFMCLPRPSLQTRLSIKNALTSVDAETW